MEDHDLIHPSGEMQLEWLRPMLHRYIADYRNLNGGKMHPSEQDTIKHVMACKGAWRRITCPSGVRPLP